MSVKIYTAYKIRPHVVRNQTLFWKWVRETIQRGEKGLQKVLLGLYKSMMDGSWEKRSGYEEVFGTADDTPLRRLRHCHETIVVEYLKQARNSYRDPFDFDVNISIRELDGQLYLIPHCDMLARDTLNFLKRDSSLVDFAYWNNVDPPDRMRSGAGYRRWKARGKVWDQLDPYDNRNRWREYLLINICDVSKFSYLDPYLDLARKLRKTAKKDVTP